MRFDDRLEKAAQARDEGEARRLLAGVGRLKLAKLALTRRLPDWLAALVRQEKEKREQRAADADSLAAAVACPTTPRLRRLPEDRDEFTRLPLAELRRRLAPGVVEEVCAAWPGADEETLAAICRWVLRGLPPELACRKVRLSQGNRRPLPVICRASIEEHVPMLPPRTCAGRG